MGCVEGTYGQERMETRAMPRMRAYLTRKAMRKAVTMPPQKTATQSYQDQPCVSTLFVYTHLWIRHLTPITHARRIINHLSGTSTQSQRR